MEQSKLVKILIIISGLIILVIYSFDIVNDYYYFNTKQATQATINRLTNNKINYLVEVSYYNENLNGSVSCSVKVDNQFGKELEDANQQLVQIVYTKQSRCNIYLMNYKHPNLGSLILHCIVFLFTLFGTYFIIIKFKG